MAKDAQNLQIINNSKLDFIIGYLEEICDKYSQIPDNKRFNELKVVTQIDLEYNKDYEGLA